METPGSLYFHCPECEKDTLHHIVKARFSSKRKLTLNGTAQCTECGFVHHIELSEEADIEVPLVLSSGDKTEKTVISLPAKDELEQRLELMFGDETIKITKLERNGLSLSRALVKDVDTIWAKKYDRIPIRVSVSHGPRTYSRRIFAAPDEEFEIGDLIRFREYRVAVKNILSEEGMVSKGFVNAKEIVRVYGTFVR